MISQLMFICADVTTQIQYKTLKNHNFLVGSLV